MMETGWAISACAGCSWEATSPAQVVGRAGDGERLLSSVPGHGLGDVTASSRKETPRRVREVPKEGSVDLTCFVLLAGAGGKVPRDGRRLP